jgi:hypothetical protein
MPNHNYVQLIIHATSITEIVMTWKILCVKEYTVGQDPTKRHVELLLYSLAHFIKYLNDK